MTQPLAKRRLSKLLASGQIPRIGFVKQDVNDDLYCCQQGLSAREIVLSTLGRPGPVALFSKFGADFCLVETEPDPKCSIWRQKWTERRWCPIEYFESFRDHVPGRPYGQRVFAVKADTVDWGQYDIVISVAVSVPARITRAFPSVVWCYYVREVSTSAYRESCARPIDGQDLHLTHRFRPVRWLPSSGRHEVEFPYHLHYVGCFHELLGGPPWDEARSGVFLEHHSVADLSEDQLAKLREFGPVTSTGILPDGVADLWEEAQTRRTMDPEFTTDFMKSKYFVKWGGRTVWGTAMVEAIAMGYVAVGDPGAMACSFLYDRHTAAHSFDEVIDRLAAMERDQRLYERVVERQRRLVDYLCFVRPSLELFDKARRVAAKKLEAC